MPWPVSGADFFAIKGGKTIEIVGDSKLDDEFHKYALQFQKAAHLLVEHLCDTQENGKLDTYFFSLSFLYRHSLELLLKSIGFQYLINENDRQNFINDTFHNLSDIFAAIHPFISHLMTLSACGWVTEYFSNIAEIDKESDSFRYPFGISLIRDCLGNKRYEVKVVFDEQTQIDLVTFANKMEITFDLLDAVYRNNLTPNNEYEKYSPSFLEEGDPRYVYSVIGYKFGFAKFYPFVTAFTESAEFLYLTMDSGDGDVEELFIPMCYLYRNAIELALKEILFEECSFDLQESLKHISKKKHSILGLWNTIINEINENSEGEDHTAVDNAERYITQLHNVDGTADKFRYPTDKYLNLHFRKSRVFDISNTNDFFSELASFLSGVNMMMSVHNEWKAEMEAEYRSEMASYYENYYE